MAHGMENNPYPEQWDQASEYLRLSLALMSKHKIPPSPLNFRLGYDSVAGKNDSLKQNFLQLVGNSAAWSPDDLLEMYQRFFVQDDKALEEFRLGLHRMIEEMQRQFENSGGNLSSFARTLNQFATVLDSGLDPNRLAKEVDKVIADTRAMQVSQETTQKNLSAVMDEIDALRREIAQIKEESLTDSLTGISNRRAFDTSLERTIESARESRTPFCVLLGDIDHFKKFNDTFGHLVGDKVLRLAASAIRRSVKGKDLVARYGGEEFAIILPQTSQIGAMAVAEQIRKAIAASSLKNASGKAAFHSITLSIGIAQFNLNDDPVELVNRADQALYQAKQNGRNRVEVWG
jgi:diguanylate cyclase